MKGWLRRSCVVAGVLAAAPGSATVIYSFTAPTSSFTYEAANFVTARTRVPSGGLSECSAKPGVCNYVDFIPGTSLAQDEFDLSATYYAGQPYSYSSTMRYFVTPGALGREGTYAAGSDAVLKVASVPEPATWTALLAGFGAIGAGMRRRRITGRPAVR